MSIENAKALIKKAFIDKELMDEIVNCKYSEFRNIAHTVGHPCEASHVNEVLGSPELSEEVLSEVAGGAISTLLTVENLLKMQSEMEKRAMEFVEMSNIIKQEYQTAQKNINDIE